MFMYTNSHYIPCMTADRYHSVSLFNSFLGDISFCKIRSHSYLICVNAIAFANFEMETLTTRGISLLTPKLDQYWRIEILLGLIYTIDSHASVIHDSRYSGSTIYVT